MHSNKELFDQLVLFLFGIATTYVDQNLYDTVYNNKENKTPWLRIIKGIFFKYRKKGSQLWVNPQLNNLSFKYAELFITQL